MAEGVVFQEFHVLYNNLVTMFPVEGGEESVISDHLNSTTPAIQWLVLSLLDMTLLVFSLKDRSSLKSLCDFSCII